MTRLKARIVDLIEALGPISVSDYMALCLSDPTDGYYSTRDPFGRGGDFITAPEISQMFGELIGVWLATAWRQQGCRKDAVIAEIGPGRGTLMKDIVRTFRRLEPDFSVTTRFNLIETSEKLRQVQANTLNATGSGFDWHLDVDELPQAQLFIVGNELFDAIPVRQYLKTEQGWRERCVDIDDAGNLRFIAGAGSLDAAFLPPDAAEAPMGDIFEIAPARSALMQKITERIARHGGGALLIDYGHLVPGIGDTLQAVLKHAYDDPLAHPGAADLTTHVDFSALAEIARAHGLDAHMTTQGEFLLGMGLLERAGQLGADRDSAGREKIQDDVERLAGPEQMGTLFKVLAAVPKGTALRPFSLAH